MRLGGSGAEVSADLAGNRASQLRGGDAEMPAGLVCTPRYGSGAASQVLDAAAGLGTLPQPLAARRLAEVRGVLPGRRAAGAEEAKRGFPGEVDAEEKVAGEDVRKRRRWQREAPQGGGGGQREGGLEGPRAELSRRGGGRREGSRGRGCAAGEEAPRCRAEAATAAKRKRRRAGRAGRQGGGTAEGERGGPGHGETRCEGLGASKRLRASSSSPLVSCLDDERSCRGFGWLRRLSGIVHKRRPCDELYVTGTGSSAAVAIRTCGEGRWMWQGSRVAFPAGDYAPPVATFTRTEKAVAAIQDTQLPASCESFWPRLVQCFSPVHRGRSGRDGRGSTIDGRRNKRSLCRCAELDATVGNDHHAAGHATAVASCPWHCAASVSDRLASHLGLPALSRTELMPMLVSAQLRSGVMSSRDCYPPMRLPSSSDALPARSADEAGNAHLQRGLLSHLLTIMRLLSLPFTLFYMGINLVEAQAFLGRCLVHLDTGAPAAARQLHAILPLVEIAFAAVLRVQRHAVGLCIGGRGVESPAGALHAKHVQPLQASALEHVLVSEESLAGCFRTCKGAPSVRWTTPRHPAGLTGGRRGARPRPPR